ncbi:MAG: LTA synthase family protein [Mangrovibacterium sp.]
MKQLFNILKHYAFWLAFFLLFKAAFIIYNYSIFSAFSFSEIWGIFQHGLVMDLSAAAYFSAIPALLFTFGFFCKNKLVPRIIKAYTILCLIFLTGLGISDMGLYAEWGTRINALALMYLNDLGGIYASMTSTQLFITPLVLIIIVVLFTMAYSLFFKTSKLSQQRFGVVSSLLALILSAALVIPIRGGFDRAPLNHSSVYFSKSLDANQAACNYFWNFSYSVMKSSDKTAKVNYMNDEEASQILSAARQEQATDSIKLLNIGSKPCNVVYVMLESFSNKVIEPLGGMANITPNLNRFCKEGIYFPNFFATGNRSDKGVTALVGGRPSDMNRRTVLYFPERMSQLDFMPKYFAKRNYDMSFYYGGDVNFYNTRSVMLQSGIDQIISKSDFPLEIGLTQKWGVPDEYLFNRFYDDLIQRPEPFFSMVYNISSHPPFDIPKNFKHIAGNTDAQLYLNSIAYTDSCLGDFIEKLKQQPQWENTLVVITSDHTSRQPDMSDINAPETYRIPLILIGGVVSEAQKIDRFGMANDLAGVLVKEMGWTHRADLLSKDFINKPDYAFYFTDNGWSYQSKDVAWFSNIETNKTVYFYNNIPQKSDSILNFAKAYVQYLHNGHLAHEK